MLVLFGVLVLVVVLMKPDDGGILVTAQTDGVTFVSDDDPTMLAAFTKARAGLDGFLALAATPPPQTESFAIKVAVSDRGRKEYFWIDPFVQHGNSFSGRISNTPQVIANVIEGQEIQFRKSDIVDWTYTDSQRRKMHGNFTACALLAHQSKKDAANFMAEYGLDCDI